MNISSADGGTQLSVDGAMANIIDTKTTTVIGSLHLRGLPSHVAISNNRQYVAAALQELLGTDLYIFKKEDHQWSMILVGRAMRALHEITWVEADTPGYPPQELVMKNQDGEKHYMPDGK